MQEQIIDHDELVIYIQQNLYGIGFNVSDDLIYTILDLETRFLEEKGLIEYLERGI